VFRLGQGEVSFSSMYEDTGVSLTLDGQELALLGRSEQGKERTLTFSCPMLREGAVLELRSRERLVRATVCASEVRVDAVEFVRRQSPSRPRVSFITCSYNRPDLLRAAVQSLRDQTDSDWEHLICDDASTDPRVALTLAWAEADPRVRVWRRGSNIDRPSVLWNFLIDRAHGKYVAVLDDDNQKLPRFVEVMAGALDADPSLGAVTCGAVIVDDASGGRSDNHDNLGTSVSSFEARNTCDGGSMLYRREDLHRVGYYSEALRTNEDWDFLRRLVRTVKVRHLSECLATYRVHEDSRMVRREDLGFAADVERVRRRVHRTMLGVKLIHPPVDRLTKSQLDVVLGFAHGLRDLPGVVAGEDLALCLLPFRMEVGELTKAASGCARALSVHLEDPYACGTNVERVRELLQAVPETWVSTNEGAVVEGYHDIVGGRVICCPFLGVDEALVPKDLPTERDIDILVCGHGYPSRRKFVAELTERLGKAPFIVGDGWDGQETLPTQDLPSTYRLHARAKAVVCLHRVVGDLPGKVPDPINVNRGMMEGYFGPRVFVDRARYLHPYDDGDVVWFDGAEDLADKLSDYLEGPRAPEADSFAAKCRSYTYRERVARILACVTSPRMGAWVP
jgi:hypothetical protein